MHAFLVNIIEILGLVGFCIAAYIFMKKKAKKKLICPRKSNCDTVIHSDYSKILGIPVEILGMIYYVFIGSIYSFIFLFGAWSFSIGILLLGVSLCAVLFSIYLVSIQAFILRHWCTWCLCSAGVSILISIFSYIHLIKY